MKNNIWKSATAVMVWSSLALAGSMAMRVSPAYAQGGAIILGTSGEDAEPPTVKAAGSNVYIIWHEFPDQVNDFADIYFSRSTNAGNTFQDRKNLSNSAVIQSDQEELAASGNNVFVAWIENNELYFTRSSDRGASFTSPAPLSNGGNPNSPRIATSGNKLIVAWEADGQPDDSGTPLADIFYRQSSDAGANFSTIENLTFPTQPGRSEFRDPGLTQIAVSNNKFVVTWRDDTEGDFEIFFADIP